jgi:hypothetical protein
MASFGLGSLSKCPSFPPKRESTPQTTGDALLAVWIPALAGMTTIHIAYVLMHTASKAISSGWEVAQEV